MYTVISRFQNPFISLCMFLTISVTLSEIPITGKGEKDKVTWWAMATHG